MNIRQCHTFSFQQKENVTLYQPDNKPFVMVFPNQITDDLGFTFLKLIIKRFKIHVRLSVFLYIKIML